MKKSIAVLLSLAFAVMASAQEEWAVVGISAAWAQSDSDYTSSFETQMLMGSVVRILETRDYWVRVCAEDPPYEAWVNEMALVRMTAREKSVYVAEDKYIFIKSSGDILSKPVSNAERLCDFSLGGLVRIAKDAGGRAIKKGIYRAVILPSGKIGYVDRKSVMEFRTWASAVAPTAEGIIATAKTMLGAPYVWGGCTSSGVDCSGLTRLSYYMNGILLPRNVSQQVECGVDVPLDALAPGDLLFFGTAATTEKPSRLNHVAIYIGNGKFIHSSQLVRINRIAPGYPDSYSRQPLCARRILSAGNPEYLLSSYYFPE